MAIKMVVTMAVLVEILVAMAGKTVGAVAAKMVVAMADKTGDRMPLKWRLP